MTTADILSSIGVVLIFLAFFLLSTDKLSSDSKAYNGLNILGASMLGVSAWMIGSVPFVILEAIWVIAAVYGFVKSKK